MGAYSAPPDPLAGFEGVYFYGREGMEKGGVRVEGRKEKEGERRPFW